LETATGRQCAKYELDGAIDAIVVNGNVVRVRPNETDIELLVRSVKVPKRRSV
jgi:hypothetical protein